MSLPSDLVIAPQWFLWISLAAAPGEHMVDGGVLAQFMTERACRSAQRTLPKFVTHTTYLAECRHCILVVSPTGRVICAQVP